LFFNSLPEASIPRDSVNGEALWRVTIPPAVIADASWNIEPRTSRPRASARPPARGDR
jgi:hypothetical protein